VIFVWFGNHDAK